MSKWAGIVAIASLLAGTSTGIAQNSNDYPRTLVPHGATAQAAARPVQQSRYTVAGLPLGSRVQLDSADYREYKCSPSEQFVGYTWCQKTRQEKDRRGSLNVSYSLLHSQDGTVFYVNRFQEPAFFGPNEVDAAIRQYSNKIGEKAEIKRLPRKKGVPEGTLATWGKIALEPLDSDSISSLAGGKSPKIGYLVDFVGDFARSAKERLPIYRISGGAGFLWVASFNQRGRGTLRITAIDPSPTYASLPPKETPSSNDRPTRPNTEAAPAPAPAPAAAAQNSDPDTDVARQPGKIPESSKPDVGMTPVETASGTQVADNQIERLNAERAKLNAEVQQLERERTAAEGKARRMESVAYGSGVIALLVIVSSIFFASRRRAIAIGPRWTTPKTKPLVTGHSSVVEIQPTSDAPPTKPSDSDPASLEMSSKPDANTAETIETGASDIRRLPIQMLQKSE